MTTNIQDLIKAKQEEIKSKKGRTRTIKPTQGKNKYRILPSWRGDGDPQFFHDFGSHFIKDEKGELKAIYVCAEKTFGKECPICQSIGQGIKSANDDETINLLKQANASQKYLLNVLHLNGDKASEPQIMEVGITVFESICEIIGEYGDVTDLKEGIDLVINREGTGEFDTKYTVMPAAKSKPVSAEVASKTHDLDEYVAQENEAARNKALNAISTAAGFLPSAAAAALSGPSKSSDMGEEDDGLDEEILDGEIVDDEFEEAPKPKAKAKAKAEEAEAEKEVDDFDDDDLDDLLDGLG